MRSMTIESCLNFIKDTFGEKAFEKPRFQILVANFSDPGTLDSSVYQEPIINREHFNNNNNMLQYPALKNADGFHTVFSFDEIIDGHILFIVSENLFEAHRFAAFLLRKQDWYYYPIHLPISNPLKLSNELILDIKKRYIEFLAVIKANNSKYFTDSAFDNMFLSSGDLIYKVMFPEANSNNIEQSIIKKLKDEQVIDFVNKFKFIKKYKSPKNELYRLIYNKNRISYNELFDCKTANLNFYNDKYIIAKDYKSLKLLSKTPFRYRYDADTVFYNNDYGDNKLIESLFSGLLCLKYIQKNTSINLVAIHNKLYLVADGVIDVKNKVDNLKEELKRAEYFQLSNLVNKKIQQYITDSISEKEKLEQQINKLKLLIATQEKNINLSYEHLNLSDSIIAQELNVEFCEEVV